TAGEYAEPKRRLAIRHDDIDDYTLAKTDFITGIERAAWALKERR
ncbi:MAG: GrpB family protein, partial [Chloroflexi bacterium]|nr:GrpB family protein [Chloroflexota bacterium]